MKKFIIANMVLVALAVVARSNAVVYFQDDFTYSDGPITNVSGGTWTGFSGASPVNVSNGQAIVSQNLTQDASADLSGSPHSNDVLYTKFDFKFDQLPTPSNSTYFFMFKDGGTNNFLMRTFGWRVGPEGTFRLGMNGTNGPTPLAFYPSDLNTGVWYKAVFRLDQTALSAPVIRLWINPTLESDSSALTTGTVPRLAISTVAFRQATTEGRVMIDNLVIGDSFAAVTVPEPSTLTLIGFGVLGLVAFARRRSSRG